MFSQNHDQSYATKPEQGGLKAAKTILFNAHTQKHSIWDREQSLLQKIKTSVTLIFSQLIPQNVSIMSKSQDEITLMIISEHNEKTL